LKKYARWSFLSAIVGVLAGISSAIFLILLQAATEARLSHPEIIWLLPLAGLLIGWIYHQYGRDVAAGSHLILDEIHNPRNVVPAKMAPLILGGTVLTHLFGGSAGREGTAVQMGASLADQLSRFFKIEKEERKILLVSGAGAGFGAAIGAPWAGMIFGMEVIQVGRLRPFAWMECFIASFIGYFTAVLLRAPHSVFPQWQPSGWHYMDFVYVSIAGVAFGLTARVFVIITHFIEKLQARFVHYPPLRPLLGGLLIVGLYYVEGSYHYAGLGISHIQEALLSTVSFAEPALKSGFTALTVGSGFKGGEFVPLVFIGTTLGSALSQLLPVSLGLLASVGFAAVFAGAANTPVACSVMAIEIFGPAIAPFALIACFASYYFSGHPGIYKTQRSFRKKGGV
jgi:H+/Cl- antiporter ClcA